MAGVRTGCITSHCGVDVDHFKLGRRCRCGRFIDQVRADRLGDRDVRERAVQHTHACPGFHRQVANGPCPGRREDSRRASGRSGVPSVIIGGTVRTAANLNKAWIGQSLANLAGARLNRQVVAINDADAAGLAELKYGAARGVAGTVLLLTLGTGIGSALFVDGRLVPNTEFGHLEVRGKEAEHRASGRAKVEGNLGWDAWAVELNLVLNA